MNYSEIISTIKFSYLEKLNHYYLTDNLSSDSTENKYIVTAYLKKNIKRQFILSKTQLENYKLYDTNNYDCRKNEFPLTTNEKKLQTIMKDPYNYYKNFSFTLTYDQIKEIYENKDHQLSLQDLRRYVDVRDYLYLLEIDHIDLSTGITESKNNFKNILIDLLYMDIPDSIIYNSPIS